MEALFPVPAEKNDKTGRGKTLALSKRSDVAELYTKDERAAPWQGTALGVMQAVNTYTNHKAAVRGVAHRAERVAENQVSGKLSELDQLAMRTLFKVLQPA